MPEGPAAQPGARTLRLTVTLTVVVATMTFLAFVPCLHNQFLAWDDDRNFVSNPDFRGLGWDQLQWMFSTFHMGHYQPVTWLTLGLDFKISEALLGTHPQYGLGMDPRPYHFTNILLHSVNAALVYLLAVRLLALGLHRDIKMRTRPIQIAACAAALLFSLHPLRVENVAWATERRDLVNALLLLLTVLAYLRASTAIDRPAYARWLVIAIALYLLSLMAKVSGVPLPVVLLALDWHPLRRFGAAAPASNKPTLMHILAEKLPFFALAAVFAFIASSGQSSKGWMFPLSLHPVEARITQSFYGLVFYLWKTVVPVNLLPLYEIHFPLNTSELKFIVSFLLVIAGTIAVLLLRRKAPALLVTMLAYAAFLGPVLGLFQNGPQIVADRYSYLPGIGVAIVLVAAAFSLRQQSGRLRQLGTLLLTVIVIALPALAVLTWRQCRVWRTSESLWRFVLEHDPQSAVACNGLGIVEQTELGNGAAAIEMFERAVRIDPMAKGYRRNLRNALRDAGRLNEVVNLWLDEAKFGQFTAPYHNEEGTAALNAGNHPLALEHLIVANTLDPTNAQSRNNLALTLVKLNRLDEAVVQYRKSVELAPTLHNPRYGLAAVFGRQGKTKEAIDELRALLQIDPKHADALNLLRSLESQAAPAAGPPSSQ